MKIIEFEQVYLEIPDVMTKEEAKNEEPIIDEEKEPTIVSLSMEELQRRLEETQTLHL